ncbi:hypothetical protein HMPREF3196_00473 [Bifidobacterium bifidum]|uniref:Uncharacterized protein n=1 Tax=Bifidobacterium bifidum TaxID=1681 RepID=A0A133KRE5_BIFBI|nr:hypothetical protein HMPREF3196_00473 [Bifidobacterium bifidum]
MTTISKHCENATCNSRKLNRIRRDTPKMWITRQPSTTLSVPLDKKCLRRIDCHQG